MPDTTAYTRDDATHSLVFERRLQASPERVYDAWLDPLQISQWWDPSGRPLARCDIDPQVGGRFCLVHEGAAQFPFDGLYRVLDRPREIVFEAMGATGSVLFEAEGDATLMTVRIACQSDAQLAQFVQMGIGDGTARTLDKLVAFIRLAT